MNQARGNLFKNEPLNGIPKVGSLAISSASLSTVGNGRCEWEVCISDGILAWYISYRERISGGVCFGHHYEFEIYPYAL